MAPSTNRQVAKKRRPVKTSVLSGTPGGDKENQPIIGTRTSKGQLHKSSKVREPAAAPLQSIHDLSGSSPNELRECDKKGGATAEVSEPSDVRGDDYNAKVANWLEHVSATQDDNAEIPSEYLPQCGLPDSATPIQLPHPSQLSSPDQQRQTKASSSKPRASGSKRVDTPLKAGSRRLRNEQRTVSPNPFHNIKQNMRQSNLATPDNGTSSSHSPAQSINPLGSPTQEPIGVSEEFQEMQPDSPVRNNLDAVSPHNQLDVDQPPPPARTNRRPMRAAHTAKKNIEMDDDDNATAGRVLLTDDLVKLLPFKGPKRRRAATTRAKAKAPVSRANKGQDDDVEGEGIRPVALRVKSRTGVTSGAARLGKHVATYSKRGGRQEEDGEEIKLDETSPERRKARAEYWKQIDDYELDVEPVLWI